MKRAWQQLQRRYLLHKGVAEPLQSLLAEAPPGPGSHVDDLEFVALDIETTGLDAATADMLSVGWVILREGRIALDTAETYLVQPSGDVGVSASVHGLTDTVVGGGDNWGVVLDKVVEVLRGRVLLVHHAGLDKALLDRMCLQRYGTRLLVPVVDTLAIEERRQQRNHHLDAGGSLRLADLRDRYGLPRYAAHDCLVDAIATAELLLVILAHRKTATLGELTA